MTRKKPVRKTAARSPSLDATPRHLWLASLGLLAYPRQPWRVAIALLAFGGAIELAQAATGWRYGEWSDWLADAVGLAAGSALAAHPRRLIALPAQPTAQTPTPR